LCFIARLGMLCRRPFPARIQVWREKLSEKLRDEHLKRNEAAGRAGGTSPELPLAFFFLAAFLVVGCYMPFMPVWLQAKGLNANQIAFALALPLFLRPLIIPLVGAFADVTGSYRGVAISLGLGALAALGLLWAASGAVAIILALALYTVLWSSQLPLGDTIAMTAARDGAHYGRMRLWGSLSFVAATLGAGAALDEAGPDAALFTLAMASGAVLLAGFGLPRRASADKDAQARAGLNPLGGLGAVFGLGGHALAFREAAGKARFWTFLCAAGMVYASHATYYAFSTMHWLSLGASNIEAGLLWTLGVFAEVALFAMSRTVTLRFAPLTLVALGGAGGLVRWTAFAFDPPWGLVAALQLLHGLTFGACHLGAMYFIAGGFPRQLSGTAQALYGAASAGLAIAAATLAVGPLYRDFGAAAYLPMAGLSLCGMGIALRLRAAMQQKSFESQICL
jgi:PPP family 3-phenylpropionic acid transporter